MDDHTSARPLARLPERLHHYAFVIADQEKNRQFFEDVLGIPLVATWCEHAYNAQLKRELDYCHTFYALADGGALAFFQYADPEAYEALKSPIPDRGQHFAMLVSQGTYDEIVARIKAAKLPLRETDHGYCRSAYSMSPDGLRVEFTVDHPAVDEINEKQRQDCHAELRRWLSGDHTTNNHDRVPAAA